jgi:hypothetical protein
MYSVPYIANASPHPPCPPATCIVYPHRASSLPLAVLPAHEQRSIHGNRSHAASQFTYPRVCSASRLHQHQQLLEPCTCMSTQVRGVPHRDQMDEEPMVSQETLQMGLWTASALWAVFVLTSAPGRSQLGNVLTKVPSFPTCTLPPSCLSTH